MNISVILTGYRRDYLNEQYYAIQNQTMKPLEILLWYNYPGNDMLANRKISQKVPTAYCTYNFGVWARFAFAFMAKGEYVCIFDDDTIPGSKYLENCYNTIQTHEGLLGNSGILYTDPVPADDPESSYYMKWVKPGPPDLETPVQVDFVGHSWFFKKEWLSDYWREQPNPKYNICGEDMHFSYMLQKYRNLPTYIPPHPADDKEMWGCLKGEYGIDKHSIHENNAPTITGTPIRTAMDEYFINQRKKGWKLINDKA